mmetsp:Transcript_7339/g.20719  ORF Transcript_7339/g.20719 Transcript_7339/m.20719 type:complete len:130 (-) Transcript_7339:41-430(-)
MWSPSLLHLPLLLCSLARAGLACSDVLACDGLPQCSPSGAWSSSGAVCDGNSTVVGVDLSHQGMEGTLPASWSALSSLQSIDLSYNNLTGPLPAEWSALSSLRTLKLRNNRLSGTLPPQWNALRALQKL